MERTDFLARISQRELLQKDASADWATLAKKYPYASLVQLLNFQSKKECQQSEVDTLRLHFEHPLHYNAVLESYHPTIITAQKKQANRKEEIESLLSSKKGADKKEEKASLAGKKKVRLPKEKVIAATAVTATATAVVAKSLKKETETVKEERVEEQPKEAKVEKQVVEVVIEKTAHTVADDNKTTVANNTAAAVEAPSNSNEDVLELIKDLPEENPIKKSQDQAELVTDTTEAPVVESEDPQDLMVMMSFTDWLHHFKSKKESEEADKKGRDAIRSAWQKEKLAEAMDDEEDVVPDDIFEKAMKSVSFGDGLVTEPLAELYVQQGKTDKAIELYKKLSLLNPQKSTYFADRIKDLRL